MIHQVSAVIISHNEARNIERCLLSLKGVADEIVVVDDFSEDETPAICKAHGASFYQQAWQGYSAQKNYANSLAKHDFILSLDADEALSDELRASILRVKKEGLEGTYVFNRLTNWCGSWIRHCGWYPDWKMRIWDQRLGRWEGEIHEEVKFKQAQKSQKLQGDCLHYSYYSLSEHVRQADKFTDLLAQQAFERGKRSNLLKILFKPPLRFLQNYFLNLGFLDGFAGFVVCRMNAHATFMKYVKLKQLQQ